MFDEVAYPYKLSGPISLDPISHGKDVFFYYRTALSMEICKVKVKSCYNPLRLGTIIVLVSSGIDFVNTPLLYSDRATR